MEKKNILIVLSAYAVSAALSFTIFSFLGKPSEAVIKQRGESSKPGESNTEVVTDTKLKMLLDIDPNAPRDQVCPLNGQLYTQVEKESWSKRRPMAVMIENHPEARPQSGFSRADVVFEAIAEGGVTRMMALYYCAAQKQDVIVAPVRSARSYFVDWASGFNRPLYVHVGGANIPGETDALGQIEKYGWKFENDLDQFSISYPTFKRNAMRLGREVATEHTMESSTEKLWTVAEERGWTNKSPDQEYGATIVEGTDWLEDYEPWSFEQEVGETGQTNKIAYEFWTGYEDYAVSWDYDVESDTYLRTMAGEQHIDLNNEEIIAPNNVIVLFTTEEGPINEKKHMIYGTVGKGTALAFKHGQVYNLNWFKPERTSQIAFTKKDGSDYEFARGMIWISVLSNDTEVSY